MKVRVLAEGARRPGLGLRFATELPNASNESGLGLDTLNFVGTILVGKTVGAFRLVGNAGVALLSDVLQGSLQHDAFVGSVSMAYALRPSVDRGRRTGRAGRCSLPTSRRLAPSRVARCVAAARYTRGAVACRCRASSSARRARTPTLACRWPDLDRLGALSDRSHVVNVHFLPVRAPRP